MRKGKTILVVTLLLLIALLLDGTLSFVFSSHLYSAMQTSVPRLILLCLLMLTYYVPRNKLIFFGILFGLLYDSYYIGILGIYIVIFPITIYCIDRMKQFLPSNGFVIGMMSIVTITLMEFILYGFYIMLDMTSINLSIFLAKRLGPTIWLNIILFILLYYPLKQIMNNFLKE